MQIKEIFIYFYKNVPYFNEIVAGFAIISFKMLYFYLGYLKMSLLGAGIQLRVDHVYPVVNGSDSHKFPVKHAKTSVEVMEWESDP